jgi:mono/diheme cytochrome c family protein
MRKPTALLALGGLAGLALAGVAGQAQDVSGGGPASVAISDEGQQVYQDICQACHLADAQGGGGAGAAIPALAGNAKLQDAAFTMSIIVKGNGGMPWFHDMLTPAQIAAVTNHLRNHFNQFPGTVSEADVVAVIAASGVSSTECSTC